MSKSPPVAIVGMSSLFAGSQDLLGFWRDIVTATDRLTDVPPHAWLIEDYYDPDPSAPDMTYAKRGGYLDPVPFNPMEFGIPPTSVPATDTAQLLALIAAKRVLADAGRFREGEPDYSRTSVVLGVASATELVVEMGSRLQHPIWRSALRQAGLPESRVQEIIQRIKDHYQPWQESTFPGLLGNVVAGRIANRLNLGGSNFVTDAACASSISALQAGLHELYLGDSDMVIAGGVDALNDILMYMCFSKTPAFSATGDCRPFSEDADGTLIGEGVGMLALRRLEDAEADGDPIYAVIRGLGASSDGKGSSVYAPRSEGQANALRRAYDKAGYGPETVELVEAHGTATKAGDAAEFGGLKSVFGPASEDDQPWCALGSVKSQIGHTKAAAGSAGLIKIALALHHRILPPTLKVDRPNSKLGLEDGPLYINTIARPWIRGSDHPRRASVSSFGFGGSNFHVTVEEYTGPGRRPDRLRTWTEELVLASAPDREALATSLDEIATRAGSGVPLARIAVECADAFEATDAARVSIVADSPQTLADKAEAAATALRAGSESDVRDADVAFGLAEATVGRVAFVFPGQGSQYVGMGAAAAMAFDDARAVWDAAADSDAFTGARLDRVVFPPPAFTDEERAAQQAAVTEMATAQPGIAAVSLGYLRLLRRIGVNADAVAGHSFGELSALAAAGRIPEDALLATARTRGELMAEAAADTEGAMIAVRSDAETVAAQVAGIDGVVVANDNAPSEVVAAGPVAAIDAAQAKLKEAGLTSIRLPVASAFHSEIVAGSCEPFHDALASVKWGGGSVDVYANKTADLYPKTAKAARRLLADQLASPVRFREMVLAMHDAGVTHFVEVGPGNVLTKLVGRCLGDRPHVAVALDDRKATGLRAFWRGLGRLAAEGVSFDLGQLYAGYEVPEAPAESQPFEIMITGFNHDRPYPPAEGAAGVAGPNPEKSEPAPVARAISESPVASTQPTAPATPSPAATPRPTAPAAPAVNQPTRVMSSTPNPVDPTQAAALTHVHQATIDAHRRYQELMAESHQAFLAMAGQALGQSAGVPIAAPAQPVVPVQPVAPLAQPVTPAVPVAAQPPAPAPLPAAPTPAAPAPAPAAPAPTPVAPAPAAEAAPAQPVAASVDTTALALEVVSEKTGYPVDMLDLDMEMEAGLGIDSIKQVEILSELQERIPGMPEIAPSELANLVTLRDVADKLGSGAAPAVEEPAAVPATVEADASEPTPVSVFVPKLVPELRPGFGLAALSRGATVQITNELPDLAASLVDGLRARGVKAEVVSEPAPGAAVISLAAAASGEGGPDRSLEVHQRTIEAARVVAQHEDPSDRLFVTVQATGGDFALSADPGSGAWLAGVSGVVKTAAREWPGASLKAIDVEDPATAAPEILGELFYGGPALEVGIKADGSRGVVRIEEPRGSRTSAPALKPGSVVVVSGGARGVTASSVAKLAEAWGVRLALLGRSQLGEWPEGVPLSTDAVQLTGALAARAKEQGETVDLAAMQAEAQRLAASAEVRMSLADLDARGIETLYLSADVTDRAALGLALDHVRETWGPIAGIVHGAGVLRDKSIADMTPDRVAEVFGPKVHGLATLLDATADDPVEVIALFSSIAARAGNAGQVAYSAANEVLNKVAAAEAARRGDGCRVRSYNWGPWAGGMVDAGLAAHFEKQGIALLSIESGTRLFVDELGTAGEGVERVVLAAPSFPRHTHRLTFATTGDAGWMGTGSAPAFVADLALRLGHALKPMHTMRTYLEDFVIGAREGGGGGVHVVDIEPVESEASGYRMVFRDADGVAQHETLVRYSEDGAAPPPSVPSGGLEPWSIEAATAYETVLGRNEDLRSIEQLEGVSEEGGMALLRSAWKNSGFAAGFDPVTLDGLIQLGALWTHQKAGAAQTLARMGSMVVHHLETIPERMRSAFRARRTDTGTLFDFILATEEGDLVAELREVEFDTLSA